MFRKNDEETDKVLRNKKQDEMCKVQE